MDKVIVDTCIWSEVFRQNSPDREIQSRMKELMLDLRVIMLGSIRQELLSGIKDEARLVAYRLKAEIFTTDKDFNYYSKYIPVELY